MSTPEPQQHTSPSDELPSPDGPRRAGLSTDMIVVLCVLGVLFVALLVGGLY